MKRVWKILGIGALVLAIGVTALGVAYAQEPTTPQSKGFLGWGCGHLGEYGEQFLDLLASKLGIQRNNLDTAIDEARKEVIEQAVKDGKITEEQVERMLDPVGYAKKQIEQMLADGKITQEQADTMLQRLEEGYMPKMRGGFIGGMKGGRHGGFRDSQKQAPSTTPAPSLSQSSTL
jgi:hypothetical protein